MCALVWSNQSNFLDVYVLYSCWEALNVFVFISLKHSLHHENLIINVAYLQQQYPVPI